MSELFPPELVAKMLPMLAPEAPKLSLILSHIGGLDYPPLDLGMGEPEKASPFKGAPSHCHLKHHNKTPRHLKVQRNIKRKKAARISRKRNR